jgi:pyruvate-ferredoxin/flavodoxin oxidoreductase
VFWGLGSDGTVSANKNSIKLIGEETDNFAQGYFVYDSKKSGARTVSHLRFGPRPIDAPFLVQSANFIGVHQFEFLNRYPVLDVAEEGGVFLLNSPFGPDQIWDELPRPIQEKILAKRLRLYVIDAYQVAHNAGMSNRINTVMQTAFFAISGVLPREEAIAGIKAAVKKTYGRRGEAVVKKNYEAIDQTLAHLHEVSLQGRQVTGQPLPSLVPDEAPEFVRKVTSMMFAERGDDLPVSAIPVDGTWPTGTTKWEKRNVAAEVPVWDSSLCIQCGKCVMVCPHAAIRSKIVSPELLAKAPEGFSSADAKWRELKDQKFTLQVAVEDCTGCGLCVQVCPSKDKADPSRKALTMAPQRPLRESGRLNWDFFLNLRGLRRNPLRQDGQPALRRPGSHRQRHRLLEHLRRQPAHHPLDGRQHRSRSRLVELALRG